MENKSELLKATSKMIEERRGNCAQIILSTYGPHTGSQKIDSKLCMNIAAAFGGGVNLTGNVCGAVTGALMALGLKYGKNIQEVTRVSNQFMDEFIAIHGSVICHELIGQDLSYDENPSKENQENVFKNCPKYIFDAAQLLEKHVELEEITL
ncbi:MAG: C_GCAxxG_C_C family protein [Promethearchaeota archaeon]|nr:MAG: C_GCAxxG_C_C family protein [Candidatus Lokiarchaeota archaeon]